MASGEQPIGACNAIDEETIELYVMDRLEEGPAREYLETCDFCKARVAEYRTYLKELKCNLRELPPT